MCHQAMFVHREVYAQLGGYDTRYRLAADYEFLLRAVAAKTAFVPVRGYLVGYRNTGLTSVRYTASINEARRINRAYCGAFSRRHLRYLAGYGKTLVLFLLQQVLRVLCGEKVLNRFRLLYMKKVIVKAEDVVAD